MSTSNTCTKVTVRQAKIKNGMISLYLDYYPAIRNPKTMRMTRREYLGIYIYANPKNQMEADFNKDMLMKAEGIRCIRVQSLINEQFGFLDKTKQKADFLAYFKEKCRRKYQKWDIVYSHFSKFVNGKCTFGDITIELCQGFRDYLLNAHQLKHTKYKLSQNSAASYYSLFKELLYLAYREKWMRENINDYLDKIETLEVRKETLTIDELKKLSQTPCKVPVLKQAALFSCLTGLRISDILRLKWEYLRIGSDGGHVIQYRIKKTGAEEILPISKEAYELCGERSTGTVFKKLSYTVVNYNLKDWLKAAGINKHITFHCFRHTYASLEVSMGASIYTVSKMLGHKNVTTTQIYAELNDANKRKASELITLK